MVYQVTIVTDGTLKKWVGIAIFQVYFCKMRSIRVAVGLFVVVLSLSSCSYYAREDKKDLYYAILNTNDTLDYMTKTWHQMLNRAERDKHFGMLGPYRLRMGEFLSRNRNKIANMHISKDALPMVDSELAFLEVRAQVVSDVYPRFEQFTEMTPSEQIANQRADLKDDVLHEATNYALIKRSLKAFAKRNKLEVKK